METCCREYDRTSLDINLKGLRDLGDNGVFLLDRLRIIHTVAAEMKRSVQKEWVFNPWMTCIHLYTYVFV